MSDYPTELSIHARKTELGPHRTASPALAQRAAQLDRLQRAWDEMIHAQAVSQELDDSLQDITVQIQDLQDVIDRDDTGALCPLTVTDCAHLIDRTHELMVRACTHALRAGYRVDDIATWLGVHRTTVSRRYLDLG